MVSRKNGASKKNGAAGNGSSRSGAAAASFIGTDAETVLTDAKIVLVDVPGSKNVGQEFKDKVMQIADRLGTNPNYLMAVMSFETGGSFSPSRKNMAGSGATGLIQFMPSTAKALGTTVEELAAMTAEEQLDFVAKYLSPFKNRMNTVEDAYMAVLFPAAIGKGQDHVIFKKGNKAYDQNRGLDINDDGAITVGEAADKVRARLGAAPTGTGEILRRGVKGPEVEKLQSELIDLGYMRRSQVSPGFGTFGPITEEAVKRFQRDNHLEDKGTYDAATQDAIRQLNEGIKRGSRSTVVHGLQTRLERLGYMTIAEVTTGQGTFGPRTDTALKTFQLQHGIQPSGVLTDETYQSLLASLPSVTPTLDHGDSTRIDTVLPAEGRGYITYRREPGGADQYGRASTIRHIQELGESWAAMRTSPRIQVGDISRQGGGPFSPHAAHQKGVEADLRPATNNGIEEATNINAANYSHAITRELAQLVKEKFPNATIFFNDQRLISEGLTKKLGGHDNHLHVRFAS